MTTTTHLGRLVDQLAAEGIVTLYADRLTGPTAETTITDQLMRGARIAVAETLVDNYLAGRVTDEHVETRLAALSPHDQPGPYFEAACEAYATWQKSQGPHVDYAALEPELAHPEVYAERCRLLLEEALAQLTGPVSVQDTALAYLLGGKVTIRKTYMPDDGPRRARIVRAVVVVDANTTHVVTLGPLLGWSCTCGAREGHRTCPEIVAVQMVTGHTGGSVVSKAVSR